MPARRRRCVFIVLLGAMLTAACGAPEPEEIAGWDASDETSVERIDHGAWQDILDAHVAPPTSRASIWSTTKRSRPTPGTS